jgi:amidophosphoribosyltransferase
MSDVIKHECGVALIRLLKPLSYYQEKYGTALYGLNKLYLLMEKQHNRGQDGAGVGVVKLGLTQGQRFMNRARSNSPQAIQEIFGEIFAPIKSAQKINPGLINDTDWLKKNATFVGELMLGHLRYGTFGRNDIETCHPFIVNDQSFIRSLIMAGNFNLTNIEDLGWHPDANDDRPDTAVVLDHVSMHLEKEIDRLFHIYKNHGKGDFEMRKLIGEKLDFHRVLKESTTEFDGGYVMAGLSGAGHAFVIRDPNGIRPVYYFKNDEVVVAASERPALQTTFNVPLSEIKELTPGAALIINNNGNADEFECRKPQQKTSCSFERIYFSRGSDEDIYTERKKLGKFLVPRVLKEINYDFENTVFSFIPNTAETAFYGLIKAGEDFLNEWRKLELRQNDRALDDKKLDEIFSRRLRIEKIALKDVKLRTFITADTERNEMVEHVYDITYGSIRPGIDSMVVIDDSIVRGTTLKRSIIRMLDRLEPKKILVVSSAPQIRYPDCYGIDMSKMKDFVAFQATIALVKERGMEQLLAEVYEECKRQNALPLKQIENAVKRLYDQFTYGEIANKVAELVKAKDIKAEVKVIFQTVEGLHAAIPNHIGDWYFSGDYPTHGGNKSANRAFINFIENRDERAYGA